MTTPSRSLLADALPRVAADLVRVGGMASLAWAVVQGAWVNAALFALVLLGLVLPRMMSSRPLVDLGYGVVVLFAAWSAVLDLYVAYAWLDVAVHAVATGLTVALMHRLLVNSGVLPSADSSAVRRPAAGVLVTAAALGCSLGVLWEVGEWYGHTFLDRRIQVGYTDTMGDLAADLLGAIVAGFVVARRRSPRGPAATAPPPTVSVVVPVKDDAVALERCLTLLAQQSVTPAEVVVVDNGCRDTSMEVATRHGARVVVEPAPGIPAAAAAGYDAAASDVIARCDADSTPPADWVERIVSAMAADPGLDALTGTGRFYGGPGWAATLLGPVYLGCYYVLVHAAMGHTPLWGSNMAMRRGAWQDVRHLVHRDDPELHDDIDLAFAMGPDHRIGYDRRLTVGVSARSLQGRQQLRRRLHRAFRTLEVNWRRTPPWLRWRARFARRPVAG